MIFLKFISKELRKIEHPNVLPNILNVGLTGGIGSGKSVVANYLVSLGAALIDLDQISHSLTVAGGLAMPSIERSFGSEVLGLHGELNRSVMRELIFKNPSNKTQLEKIIHPLITSVAIEKASIAAQAKPIFIVYDIPLLARSKEWLKLLDYIVVVQCDTSVRIERIEQRNPNLSHDMIVQIIKNQADESEMRVIADALIDNSENDPQHLQLYRQVNILAKHLKTISELPQ